MSEKVLGQNDGKDNEKLLIDAINGKRLCEIPSGPQAFLKDTKDTVTDNTEFVADSSVSGMKPDIEIAERGYNTEWYVSVKKGSNNSVHQEKIDYLIQYATDELDMNDEERDSILLYFYGDGTLDGNTTRDKWMNEEEVKEHFSHELSVVQHFLDKNKRSLVERFLVYGRLGKVYNIKANYIYHGTTERATWCKLNDATIDYLVSMKNGIEPSIGPLHIKSWGRGSERNRHSLQVMWSNCENDLKTIHDMKLEDVADEEEIHVVGDNSHGFANQNEFCELINNKRFKQLPMFVRNMIKTVFPSIAETEYIHAYKRNDYSTKGYKNSIVVTVNGETKSISIHTTDKGISGHQENIDEFLKFCRETLDLTEQEEYSFRLLHYGDGTIDGSGNIKDRKDNKYLIKNYSEHIKKVQDFIDRNKRDLLERVLVYGKNGKRDGVKVDYIFIGTTSNGVLASTDDIIDSLIETSKNMKHSYLHLCSINIQTYRRNLNGDPKQEEDRHSIQFKVGSIGKIIENIEKSAVSNIGTLEGDREEYALVKRLNSNKKSAIWKQISEELKLESLDDVYAVKVLKLLPSEVSKSKVKPKADIYLVTANISQQQLLKCNYWLDEETISDNPYKRIDKSGISVKRPDSKHFNYMKFTINTFNKIFNNSYLGAGICLYAEKNLNLNEMIIEKWGLTITDFIQYFSDKFEEIRVEDIVTNNEICLQIKRYAIDAIKKVILEDDKIAEYIFKGIGAFEEPYTANFTYINGVIEKTDISPNFNISTGSGRHRGNITIIITP
jgi:hypothetical protein